MAVGFGVMVAMAACHITMNITYTKQDYFVPGNVIENGLKMPKPYKDKKPTPLFKDEVHEIEINCNEEANEIYLFGLKVKYREYIGEVLDDNNEMHVRFSLMELLDFTERLVKYTNKFKGEK